MRRKVMWISVWATLVLWLGNFWGCSAAPKQTAHADNSNETQRVTPSDTAEMPESPDADTDVADVAAATPVETQTAPIPAVSAAAQSSAIEVTPVQLPSMAMASVQSANPAAGTLDRSDWPQTVVRPNDGTVRHYHLYWKDYPLWEARRELERDPLTEIGHALDGAKPEGWSWRNFAGVFVEPVKFGVDSVLVAPKMIVDPPWEATYSP